MMKIIDFKNFFDIHFAPYFENKIFIPSFYRLLNIELKIVELKIVKVQINPLAS